MGNTEAQKRLILPKVISEEKISKGLLEVENLKHKALLFTAYDAGLSVSEVVALKVTDIDSDRMQIRIATTIGKKNTWQHCQRLLCKYSKII